MSRVQALFAIEPAAAASPGGAGGPVPWGDRVADTAAVYERGRLLAEDLAAGSGVPVRFFWLPYQQGSRAGDQYREVAATLDPSVGDLSGLLDGVDEPVFLDDARVNERGARLVAEAIYEAVRPQLVALDRGR